MCVCVQWQGDSKGFTKLNAAHPPGKYSQICCWGRHLLQPWKILLCFLQEASPMDCGIETLF